MQVVKYSILVSRGCLRPVQWMSFLHSYPERVSKAGVLCVTSRSRLSKPFS